MEKKLRNDIENLHKDIVVNFDGYDEYSNSNVVVLSTFVIEVFDNISNVKINEIKDLTEKFIDELCEKWG